MDKLNVSDYDYFLPEEQIAQDPLARQIIIKAFSIR